MYATAMKKLMALIMTTTTSLNNRKHYENINWWCRVIFKIKDLYVWRNFYALMPVRIDDVIVWLETVERRKIEGNWASGDIYEYRIKGGAE